MYEVVSEPVEPEQNPTVEVLRELISEMGDNWSGYGCKLWLEYKIRDIEAEDDLRVG